MTKSFAALHEFVLGTKLPFAALHDYGRCWGYNGHVADVAGRPSLTPEQTSDIRHRVRQSSLTGRGVISDQAARVSPNAQCGSVPASQADRKRESAHQNEADGPSRI